MCSDCITIIDLFIKRLGNKIKLNENELLMSGM